jgi:diguanylate cyclase (GGDEF)-like protein/putative nucleotidyltransferase with HDIG domain
LSSAPFVSALEALALAIDATNRTPPLHIRRVRAYATALARALGMPEGEVAAVDVAAMLHDIGKLAVPEYILSKTGPLTPEELQKIHAHPKAGADLVGAVPFPHPVAPIILGHHERWDGTGYPAGLKGEEIPLGARVLAVADCFDTLMGELPRDPAAHVESAGARLRQEAGKHLDPRVVERFVELLPALPPEVSSLDEATGRAMPLEESPQEAGPAAPALMSGTTSANVFDEIALARRESRALYELARGMGTAGGVSDTMALIAGTLGDIVPASCVALFLHDQETGSLRCRFAAGADADIVRQISVRTGEGMNGWVASHRRSLVSAQPNADLEAAGLSDLRTTLQSGLACPLIFDERLLGTLAVYHTGEAVYRDDHRRLLDHVSEQAAAVINYSRQFEQTQEASLTDPLTGLPNTGFLFMYLTRELARAERVKSELGLLVIHLDDLAGINRTHGHYAGDRALCEVARVLRSAIRPYDVAVRYKGREFIVVLSGCGAIELEQRRQEMKKSIDDVYFETAPGKRLKLTISSGGATLRQDGSTYEALLAVAGGRLHADSSWKG